MLRIAIPRIASMTSRRPETAAATDAALVVAALGIVPSATLAISHFTF
jgi:hypothetical protein